MMPFVILGTGLIVAAIGLVVAMILYHLNRFSVEGDATPFIRKIFIAGNIVFLVLTVAVLLFLLRRS